MTRKEHHDQPHDIIFLSRPPSEHHLFTLGLSAFITEAVFRSLESLLLTTFVAKTRRLGPRPISFNPIAVNPSCVSGNLTANGPPNSLAKGSTSSVRGPHPKNVGAPAAKWLYCFLQCIFRKWGEPHIIRPCIDNKIHSHLLPIFRAISIRAAAVSMLRRVPSIPE